MIVNGRDVRVKIPRECWCPPDSSIPRPIDVLTCSISLFLLLLAIRPRQNEIEHMDSFQHQFLLYFQLLKIKFRSEMSVFRITFIRFPTSILVWPWSLAMSYTNCYMVHIILYLKVLTRNWTVINNFWKKKRWKIYWKAFGHMWKWLTQNFMLICVRSWSINSFIRWITFMNSVSDWLSDSKS